MHVDEAVTAVIIDKTAEAVGLLQGKELRLVMGYDSPKVLRQITNERKQTYNIK